MWVKYIDFEVASISMVMYVENLKDWCDFNRHSEAAAAQIMKLYRDVQLEWTIKWITDQCLAPSLPPPPRIAVKIKGKWSVKWAQNKCLCHRLCRLKCKKIITTTEYTCKSTWKWIPCSQVGNLQKRIILGIGNYHCQTHCKLDNPVTLNLWAWKLSIML